MTDTESAHPSAEQLTAFGLGRLGERDETAVVLHLEGCAACRTAVEGLSGDSFVARLRDAGAATCADVRAPAEVPPELAAHPRYRVLGLLGAGGMGAVYRAEHVVMERPVALKVVNRALTDRPGMAERFRREVKAAAQLSHPNIVHAYDADQAGDLHFLVMEYVEGVSLARLVAEEGPLLPAQACEYVRQAALGLQYAHERGMVHRDVKPHNLMLTPAGQVKVLDFGLARFALRSLAADGAAGDTPAAAGEALTQLGTVVGTPDYIAPEQAADAAAADIRADVYSLGCTLYHLLAGAPPFHAETVVGKVRAHAERAPRPLAEVRPHLPAGLAAVVERMMAKDPARRYPTPAEVARALAPFLPGAPRRRQAPPWGCVGALLGGPLTLLLLWTGWGAALVHAVGRALRNEGTVDVVVDDPEAQWLLAAEGVTVHDRDAGRTYTLRPGVQSVKAGWYEVRLSERTEVLQVTCTEEVRERGPDHVRLAVATGLPRQLTPGAEVHVRLGSTALRVTRDVAKVRAREEKARMAGGWVVTEVQGGRPPLAVEDLLMLDGDRFTLRPRGGTAVTGAVRLNLSNSPREVDLLPADGPYKGERLLGVFEPDEEGLRLCLGAAERPFTFAARPGAPVWLVRLRRTAAARWSAEERVYRHVLGSVAYFTPRDGRTGATATVIDRANRLLLTCDQGVPAGGEVSFYFPAWEDGRLLTGTWHYRGPRPRAAPVRGRRIDHEDRRERRSGLALLQLDRLPDGVAALPVAAGGPRLGAALHAVGNPAGCDPLWVYSATALRLERGKQRWQVGAGGEALDYEADWLMVRPPPRAGDSGGALVNDRGELVGVALGGQPADTYVGRATVLQFLERAFREAKELRGKRWERSGRALAPPGRD
jgi:uncharacterized protein (TIGR03067 family)